MSFLTDDYRRTAIRKPGTILSGVDASLSSIAGFYKRRASVVLELLKTAEDIDAQADFWKNKTDAVLRSKLSEFREIFRRRKRGYESLLPDALAAIREASDRSIGLRPFVVQLAGSAALYHGTVAEMATGEGKTLTAGLTAVIWGWTGLPCHIITVNDYLADRDSKRLAGLYEYCGVSVGCVIGAMDSFARRTGYQQDVTYTTSKEIVADFLRDRLWLGPLQNSGRRQIRALLGSQQDIEKGLVMRGIHSAIVDEADSILIDEAVTPLIISQTRQNQPFIEACKAANVIVSALKRGVDYKIIEKYKDVEFLPGLQERLVEQIKQMPALFRGSERWGELIHQALIANEFFHRDKQYVIQNNKVVIVDEFTGRLMQQRTWRSGLHQLIEAKENIAITSPSETLARLSFQSFYRFFYKLSGMTGTAHESANELWQIYGLPVLGIPPNRPCQREIYPRRIFADQESKWQAIVEEIISIHNLGRPILIGTRSVKTSEDLTSRLAGLGLSCRVLNAVRHREEAEIISHAGERGMITVATNMAGRGTDVHLGSGVAESGGLHVIATECHESVRIDRQLFGRSARQGDPGSARSFVSMDDELMVRYLPAAIRKAIKTALWKGTRTAYWAADRSVQWAQSRAQRIAFRQRHSVLRMDTWLDDSLSFAPGDVL